MRRSILLTLLALLAASTFGFVAIAAESSLGTEVMHNVFDNGKHSCYIKVDDPARGEEDAAVAEITAKKEAWREMFPSKKINSMTVVTGDKMGFLEGMKGNPIVVGLMIDYDTITG